MPDLRLLYAPLALLIAFSGPSYGQAQEQDHGTQAPTKPHKGQVQRPQGQVQRPQGQVPRPQGQVQRPQGQVQRPQGQVQRPQGQVQRRTSPNIEIYRGPQDYRSGSRPPSNVLRHRQNRDFQRYHHEYRAERRYHVDHYSRPHGWYPYQWVLGGILPHLFWSQNYWIIDYWLYGLPIPPYDCVWVRYENDALLIDRRSGEVIEVIYDIFY